MEKYKDYINYNIYRTPTEWEVPREVNSKFKKYKTA